MSATDYIVFVIDDDEGIRSSLERSLSKRGFSVQTFAAAKAFLDVYDASMKGCIILDQGMPEMTGLELQELLVARGRTLPIIFITGHAGIPETVLAMKAGAVDFLEKPFRSDVLVERINTAFASLADRDKGYEKAKRAKDKIANLTTREKEIVEFIVTNPSHTTSKSIARALDISPRTVDHHRARILEKMQIKSVAELIDIAISAKSDTMLP